jgi:hypothetical protein
VSTHSVLRWWHVSWGLEKYLQFDTQEAAENFVAVLRLNDAHNIQVTEIVDEVHTFPDSNTDTERP